MIKQILWKVFVFQLTQIQLANFYHQTTCLPSHKMARLVFEDDKQLSPVLHFELFLPLNMIVGYLFSRFHCFLRFNQINSNYMAIRIKLLSLITIFLSFCLVQTQFSPAWNTSLYIETKTFNVVSGTSKTFGTFLTNITFGGTYPTPSLALSIPQLRIVSNNKAMDFNCAYSALNQTFFTHTLEISSSNTVVWYLVVRYFVVSLQLLPKTIQGGLLKFDPSTINSGAGSSRSETFANNTVLSFAMTNLTSSICVPFLTGVKATTSADHYQLNLTCAVTSASGLTITAIVHPETLISKLSVHVLVYDPNDMAVLSIYFADYTTTTTYLGTQTVVASLPKGYFDSNFMGGLASFSMQNNIQFNVTLAIPTSTSVYTSASSLYNSIPVLQIRVRYCPSAFPNYNILDGLCYTTCPSTTYFNSTGFICYACGNYCLTCLNISVCTNCISTMILSSGSCICPLTSYLYGGVCYGCDYTCQTCNSTGQFINCLTCDSSNYRINITASPYQCPCDAANGFIDVGVAMCQDKCGDGKANTAECDDNNTDSGDGCSSSCTIQANFTCEKDNAKFSKCYYTGNVTLQVRGIYKQQFSNQVTFYIQIKPFVNAMKYLADNPLSITSNGTVSANGSTPIFSTSSLSTYIDPDEPDVINFVYTATYTQRIQESWVRFDLKPSNISYINPQIFSRLPPTNITVECTSSNAYKLIMFSDSQYQIASNFRYVCLVFGYLMLASAPLYIFGRLKWVGNMLFLSLQFQYLNMAILDHFTPMLSGLSFFKALMGYNQLMGIHQLDVPKYSAFLGLNYNMTYEHNVNFMVSFQALGLVMYAIYYIFWRKNQLVCKKYGGDPEKTFVSTKLGKFLSFFNWQFFMFWNFFNMTTQILGMILHGEIDIKVHLIPLQAFCMICILLALLPLFVKRKQVPSYTQLLYYKDGGQEEQLVTLGAFAVMYLLFYFARTQTMAAYYGIFVPPICLVIYQLCRKPFQSRWIRAAYLINCFCIVMSLIYNRITITLGEEVEYLPFGNFIVIIFDWVFNIVVWCRQAYIICKYGGEEGFNQILQSNTKTTEETNDFNNYFQPQPTSLNKNNSLLDNIMKSNNKKLSNNTSRPPRKESNPQSPSQPNRQNLRIAKEENQSPNSLLHEDVKKQDQTKEMQEMKEIRELRERTRQSIRKSRAINPIESKRLLASPRVSFIQNQY